MGALENTWLAMMSRKQKELAMNSGNIPKSYIIEINIVSVFLVAGVVKKKGSSAESVGRLWFR
jgi:hypothetical protein